MIMCSVCKKRPAVVFITAMRGTEKVNEGLCLSCARTKHIPQVEEYMDKLGITNEDADNLAAQMMEMFGGMSADDGEADELPNDMFSKMFGMTGFAGTGDSRKNEASNDISDSSEKNAGGSYDDDDYDEFEDDLGIADPGSLFKTRGFSKKTKTKENKEKMKNLGKYCINLTEKAAHGQIDRVIGRDHEIARMIQILSRRQKNNPCLIGEPGVGKTAIAEALAQKIYDKEVPYSLYGKKVYILDLTALVAGTQFRGQFESRVKGLVDEVKRAGNVILFIDEIHTLVSAGDAEGSMNAANILKPALSRGEIQVIGATTFSEYRKYIEKDSALERRFQPITVEEPNIEDTVAILTGIKKYYEDHHKVKISDYYLRVCAVLSERYITDRFLPDKAIDLMDESCAYASIRTPEVSEYQKKQNSAKRFRELIETLSAETQPDYETITELRGKLIQIESEIDRLRDKAENVQVTENDITKVIELWTGIPASKIAETEFLKISRLEEALKKRVIGQDEAVSVLARAIKRTRVQLNKRRRPASFVFVGPTGVGKTELVKAISEELFNSTEPLIRLDMTEYMEKHSVARMIGSPPGYVGYEEAGQLTEKIRRRPYSVILFDEIEKAHPDVMNILMQILDEGRIDDAQGRTINFENTIICMTSNAGSTDKSIGVGFNRTESDISRDKAIKGLREFLRPEFISRLDEIVVFKQLTKDDFAKIAALMLDEMKEPLAEKEVTLAYNDEVLKLIAEKSYGKPYGARDIRRVIRQDVEDKIADILITSGYSTKEIDIAVKDGEITAVAKRKDNQ